MARDFKLGFTFADQAVSTTVIGATKSTPSGEPADSGVTIALGLSSTGTQNTSTTPAYAGVTKNVAGFVNSKMDTSSFANFIAGNEVTSVSGDAALWGNTSPAEMFLHSNLSWNLAASGSPTAANIRVEAGGQLIVQGAYDDGTGSALAQYVTLGAYALTNPVANVPAQTIASGVIVTTRPHGLVPGQGVVFHTLPTGLSNVTANQIYRVGTVPSAVSFTLLDGTGTALGTAPSGTITAAAPVFIVNGFNPLATTTAFGPTQGKIISIPIVESIRPYMRVALNYSCTNVVSGTGTINTSAIILNRCALVTGRESSATI